jgi:hypothetical protein
VPIRLTLAVLLQIPVSGTPAPTAPGPLSAHWKSTVTVDGARPGEALQEAEIWLSGGRMRIDERGTESEATHVVVTGSGVFIWVDGRAEGVRVSPALAARGRPMHSFVARAAEIRARGKKTGEEKVDGHPCDVFEFESREEGKGSYWLARDLGDFPVQAVLESRVFLPGSGRPVAMERVRYRNRDVRLGDRVPAGLLEPPAGVAFQDASEIFLNRGRPGPRSPATRPPAPPVPPTTPPGVR